MKHRAFANWHPDEHERLRTLWAEGLSAGEIAAAMAPRSRNAVIGQAHRLGLSRRVSPLRAPAKRPNRKRPNAAPPDPNVLPAPRRTWSATPVEIPGLPCWRCGAARECACR